MIKKIILFSILPILLYVEIALSQSENKLLFANNTEVTSSEGTEAYVPAEIDKSIEEQTKEDIKKEFLQADHLTKICKNVLKKWRGSSQAKSRRMSYKGVKKCLLEAGLVSSYLPGKYAKNAGRYLKGQGFKKITTLDPRKAPAGSIIVYKHTRIRNHPGHIEIKGTDGKSYSDFIRKGTSLNRSLKVIGIYNK